MKKLLTFIAILPITTLAFTETIRVPQDIQALQVAIESASSGDTVLVDEGTYMENIRFEQGKKLVVCSKFLITGDTSNISKTILNGFEHGPVVKFNSDTPTGTELSGFTITNGNGEEGLGGGILIYGSSPILTHLIITENVAVKGGGIFCIDQGRINLSHSTVSLNKASNRGGGIHMYNSDLQLTNCIFKDNEATNALAGAISFNMGGTLPSMPSVSIDSTLIVNNKSTETGVSAGAYFEKPDAMPAMTIHIRNSAFIGNISAGNSALRIHGKDINFVLTNCLFESNEARNYTGGAAFTNHCTGQVINCQFINNKGSTASENWNTGGATVWNGATVDFYNCCFTGNTAPTGAALTIGAATATLTHCIFWSNGNEPMAIKDLSSTGSTLTVAYSNIQNGANSINKMPLSTLVWQAGNINTDPLFMGSGMNPFALAEGSPCIDAGSPNAGNLPIPSYDFMGNKRVWDGDGNETAIIDIGPYEYGSIPLGIDAPGNYQKAEFVLCVYPNPSSGYTSLEYHLKKPAQVTIEIYNQAGHLIHRMQENQTQGMQYIQWMAGDSPPGIYHCRIQAGDLQTSTKLILY